ncbi:MAG: GlmU family protein [Bacteroidetes bacterium]|nr:GlmU family protein [Bacteroidota bacterium]
MNYIIFDNFRRNYLLPLTFVRPVCDIRVGILTIREKWERYLGSPTSTLTEPYLSEKFPMKKEAVNILINGSVIPNAGLAAQVAALKPRQALVSQSIIIAMHVSEEDLLEDLDKVDSSASPVEELEAAGSFLKLNHLWDIFSLNGAAMEEDYRLLTEGRKSAPIPKSNRINGSDIFIEEGAKVEMAYLNASSGPIYIGRDAEIMEGAMIRGPFALLDHAVIKMGAKIYGASTFGPYCKVGGEVNNSVFLGYSNKAHDGFIGNSVIGEWCNIGADTNNSNLKNNYDEVRLWSYPDQTFIPTSLQFCGLILGDHSKCAINTMFNTGTVVGVSANIFGPGFQRNFIPSFVWGGTMGFSTFKFERAMEVAERVYQRRDIVLDDIERRILKHVYETTRSNKRLMD